MSRRNDLLSLLATRSAKRGTFTLASGRQSSLYIDARITTMSPDGLALIGPLGVEAIAAAGWNADSVGGLTMGADPVACAISYASAATPNPLRAFTVRKEPKTHGTGKLIEGPFRAGDRVVVIEDTITTGGSARGAGRLPPAVPRGRAGVVPADQLQAKTLEMANRIAEKSPIALQLAKEAVKLASKSNLDEGLRREVDLFALCFSTEDKNEGVSAFLEKRKAVWKGK